MSIQKLIGRERRAHRELVVGTIIGQMAPKNIDGAAGDGSGIWMVKVDIGSNRIIEVPVKATNNGRNYASLGQTVQLRRNAGGRFEVIGPGDRLSSIGVEKVYDLAGGQLSSANIGFTFQQIAWTVAGSGGTGYAWDEVIGGKSRWERVTDGTDSGPSFISTRQVDGDGNPV